MSAISGVAWALIADIVMYSMTGSPLSRVAQSIGTAMIAAPVIGMLLAPVSRKFASFRAVRRSAIALLDLYVAAFLFLWAAGLDPFKGVILGLTLSGYVIILWPLSYANHLLVSFVWRQTVPSRSDAS